MNTAQRVEKALDDAIVAANQGATTAAVVRSALRVAVLRQDSLAEFWLYLEVDGVRKDSQPSEGQQNALHRHTASLGPEKSGRQRSDALNAFMSRRRTGHNDDFLGLGVGEVEANQIAMEKFYDEPITPGMTPLDTGLASKDREKARAAIMPGLIQNRAILERIRQAAYSYLLEVEADLINGQLVPDVVAQGQAFVKSKLAKIAPTALEALAAAQARLAEGDSESMSHAATSCRRVIKSLADALYPAGAAVQGDDGVTRSMDDEHYRNRLVEYVRRAKKGSTHADLIASNLVSLGTRLKSLDDLSSKGVHTTVSGAEAESCVAWTFMLAADLLRIEDQAAASNLSARG